MTSQARDIELLLDQWFEQGPSAAPRHAVDGALERAWLTPQARPMTPSRLREALTPRAWLGAPAVRLWAVVVLGLIGVIGAVAIAGSSPRPQTFTSQRYGYSIGISSDWTVRPAASGWGVTDPWDVEPVADVFLGPGVRFTAVSLPLAVSRDLTRWADIFVPDRPELSEPRKDPRCLDPRGLDAPIPIPSYRGWEPARIGGNSAVVRVACGYIDAVVMTAHRAYVLSMFSGRQALADVAAFDAFVRTVTFAPKPPLPTVAPPSASPAPATAEPDDATFDSPLYGYRLAHPSSWGVEQATQRWTGSGDLESPVADRFDIERGLFIAAIDLEEGVSVESWLAGHVPLPDTYDADGGYCEFRLGSGMGATMFPSGAPSWEESTVGDAPAWKRMSCGYVHAVVPIGRRAYVLEMFTGRQPRADTAAFDAATDGIEFDPAPGDAPASLDPDVTVPFDSPRYGYRAETPWRWAREPATRSAVDLRPVGSFGAAPEFDRFFDGVFSTVWVASAPVATGTTAIDWAQEHAPSRQTLDPGGDAWMCRGPNGGSWMHIPYAPWRPSEVAGHESYERDSCFFLDVVTIVGDRGYVVTARSNAPTGTQLSARAYLDDFLASLEFRPDDARDAP